MANSGIEKWDQESDVIVVGYGLAGAATAINAHDMGAKVIILEKAPTPGGSSVTAGGMVKIAENAEGAFKYLSGTQGGRCSGELIRTMAQGLTEVPHYIEELVKVNGAKFTMRWDRDNTVEGAYIEGTYAFPGRDSLGTLHIHEVPGFDWFPWCGATKLNGQRLVKLFIDNVTHRAIPVLFSTSVKGLVRDAGGEIRGVTAEREGKIFSLKAKKGVILACGGFQFNEKLRLENFEAKPVYPIGHLGNTGDGVLMAQRAGAALWHMWHYHGSYGFKFKEFPMAFRHHLGGGRHPKRKVVWINVDRYGKRFMNEYHPKPQDTMHRPLQYFDPDTQDYPRIPCYLIFDEEGRKMGPLAHPLATTPEYHYQWSRDNNQEVEKGWIVSARSIQALAGKIDLTPATLARTVRTWNKYCLKGKDEEFHRPPGTMVALEHPPYYAMEAWPICCHTQGGPEHNVKQQVVDPYGHPIPRLYAVGELGSFYGHLYLGGGNMAECIIGGRIAGKMVAQEKPWE